MPITLRLEGARPLEEALRRAPRTVAAEQARAMEASLLLVEGDARRNARQDTRRLMNSITHRIQEEANRLLGRVGPSVGYGLYVERGARPHWAPLRALEPWARRHGVPVYAVRYAIARRGTKARPFLLPAFTKNAAAIVRRFARAGANVAAQVATQSGGRA